jgi:hypothetical protein
MKLKEKIPKEILFVDEIGFISLLSVLFLFRSVKEIWYFEPMGLSFQNFLNFAKKFGLLSESIKRVRYNIGQIRNRGGSSEFPQIRLSILAICKRIKQEHFFHNPLIQEMGKEWTLSKILLHFEQVTEREINEECLRIGLIRWMLQTQLCIAPQQCVVLIKRKKWAYYIQEYATSEGVQLSFYQHWNFYIPFFIKLIPFFKKYLLSLKSLIKLKSSFTSIKKDFDLSLKKDSDSDFSSKSIVAINYWYRNLSFDPAKRSEFFWVDHSGIPYSSILLYNYVSETPIPPDIQKGLQERGIKILGKCPGVPYPKFSSLFPATFSRICIKILKIWLTSLVKNQWISPYYVMHLTRLAFHFSFWYDFYTLNRVRINIGTQNTTMGQALAMDAMGIMSCSFQYSASNICHPHYYLTSGEDVYFMFSPTFEKIWRNAGSPVENYVNIGFIYDNAFKEIRNSTRIDEIKSGLRNQGANFIICFFDENSAERWEYFCPHKELAQDYEFLLQWLIEEPSIGLVFKPKKMLDLFQRIGDTSNLIKQAQKTGRCKILDDNFGNNMSPAEAALIADICIGKLGGVTAALEAQLIGSPSILIDVDQFNTHPFYSWDTKDVVFNNWRSLRLAVEKYRTNPAAYPELGHWGNELKSLDPYQDGKANLRMGSYIGNVYDAINAGKSKKFALQFANEKFQSQW